MPKIATNEVFRRKYFIDSAKIVFANKNRAEERPAGFSPIIDAKSVTVSKRPVSVRCSGLTAVPSQNGDGIKVEEVREGNRIKRLRIVCPCGRHTERDVEYAPAAPEPPKK